MAWQDNEEVELRAVLALNAQSVFRVRHRVEEQLLATKAALERKTLELDHSLSMLRATLDAVADGILVTSLDGAVSDCNGRFVQMWRIPRELMEARDQRRLFEAIAAQARDRLQLPTLTARIALDAPQETFDVIDLADGRTVECVTRVQSSAGRTVGRVWCWRDVSQRVKLEAQLRQAQRLESMGQLTGGVAHDFNNILTVILGNADVLAEDLAGSERFAEPARMIVSAAEHGVALTRQLLAFGRRQPLQPAAVDIGRLLAAMESLLRSAVGEQVEIEMALDAGLWRAMVDPAQLESALLNLCINGRDAMPAGGRLTIATSNTHLDRDHGDPQADVAPGNYVLVAVSDTGTGIAPEHLARVFEPFYTTKEAGRGTGLGLSIVYGFVKQSRGHVRIDSTPGCGTTVALYLPCAAP